MERHGFEAETEIYVISTCDGLNFGAILVITGCVDSTIKYLSSYGDPFTWSAFQYECNEKRWMEPLRKS